MEPPATRFDSIYGAIRLICPPEIWVRILWFVDDVRLRLALNAALTLDDAESYFDVAVASPRWRCSLDASLCPRPLHADVVTSRVWRWRLDASLCPGALRPFDAAGLKWAHYTTRCPYSVLMYCDPATESDMLAIATLVSRNAKLGGDLGLVSTTRFLTKLRHLTVPAISVMAECIAPLNDEQERIYALSYAGERNNLAVVQWLVGADLYTYNQLHDEFLNCINLIDISRNRFEVASWMADHLKISTNSYIISLEAPSNSDDYRLYVFVDEVFSRCCIYGHFESAQWLVERFGIKRRTPYGWSNKDIIRRARENGHHDIAQWVSETFQDE